MVGGDVPLCEPGSRNAGEAALFDLAEALQVIADRAGCHRSALAGGHSGLSGREPFAKQPPHGEAAVGFQRCLAFLNEGLGLGPRAECSPDTCPVYAGVGLPGHAAPPY